MQGLSLTYRIHNFQEAFQAGFDVLDNFTGQYIRVRKVIQALVFELENTELGFVGGGDFSIGEFPLFAFCIFLLQGIFLCAFYQFFFLAL